MKTNLHENGWVLNIDEDIKSLTQSQVKEVAKLINRHLVVTFKNQDLEESDEVKFCGTMGDVQIVYGYNEQATRVSSPEGIIYVTGKRPDTGEEGLFGHKEVLDWHTHQPANPERLPYTYLYSKAGSIGSVTSWINMILAYNDLDDDVKQRLESIRVYCGFERGKFSGTDFFNEFVDRNNPIKLIHTNIEEKTGLYFPMLQILDIDTNTVSQDEWDQLYKHLYEHVNNSKYIYDHHWEDNDVVVFEQWISIHKRWPFENINDRLLHRIAMDYNHVYSKS